MYNKVILIGNLTRDPELRYTPSGLPVARFTLAVNRLKKKNGEKNDVDFINITAWRRLAEICGEYLKKGMPVEVDGRLSIRSYVSKTGEKRIAVEVVADNMQMLGRKQDNVKGQAVEAEKETSEEVPF
ncbi:MAG: single-stranded DNA-binding protein [Candidatus Margulisiibacteriota bacterium]